MSVILNSLIRYFQLILAFLNENSGGITTIATVGLAVVTAIYVFLTKMLIRETRRQADLALNERRATLHREMVERVHLPLKNQIIWLINYNPLKNGTDIPRTLAGWENIMQQIPHLAYQMDEKLFATVNTLVAILQKFCDISQNIEKTVKDTLEETFGEPEVRAIDFIYEGDQTIQKTPLEIIFADGDLKDYIQKCFKSQLQAGEIDAADIEFKYLRNVRRIEIPGPHKYSNLAQFIEPWDRVRIKIKANPEFSTWLEIGNALVSKAKNIVDDLDKTIKISML